MNLIVGNHSCEGEGRGKDMIIILNIFILSHYWKWGTEL